MKARGYVQVLEQRNALWNEKLRANEHVLFQTRDALVQAIDQLKALGVDTASLCMVLALQVESTAGVDLVKAARNLKKKNQVRNRHVACLAPDPMEVDAFFAQPIKLPGSE